MPKEDKKQHNATTPLLHDTNEQHKNETPSNAVQPAPRTNSPPATQGETRKPLDLSPFQRIIGEPLRRIVGEQALRALASATSTDFSLEELVRSTSSSPTEEVDSGHNLSQCNAYARVQHHSTFLGDPTVPLHLDHLHNIPTSWSPTRTLLNSSAFSSQLPGYSAFNDSRKTEPPIELEKRVPPTLTYDLASQLAPAAVAMHQRPSSQTSLVTRGSSKNVNATHKSCELHNNVPKPQIGAIQKTAPLSENPYSSSHESLISDSESESDCQTQHLKHHAQDLNQVSISASAVMAHKAKAAEFKFRRKQDYVLRRYFVVRMAESLFRYGAPSYRLEHVMQSTARELGVIATSATLPSLLILSFLEPRSRHIETVLLPVNPGNDMERLYIVGRLCLRLSRRQISLQQGVAVLDVLAQRKHRFNRLFITIAWMSVSGLMALLGFGGSWWDVGASVLAGAQAEMVLYACEHAHNGTLRHIADAVAAFVVAFAAVPLKRALGVQMCFPTVVLSGIMGSLPGMALCTALVELVTGHVVLGTARLAGGLMRALTLGFGITFGYHAWHWLLDPSTAATGAAKAQDKAFFECKSTADMTYGSVRGTTGYWLPLFLCLVPITGLAMCVTLRAAPGQMPIMVASYTVAYWSGVGLNLLGVTTEFNTIVVSFLVSLLANTYSRITKHPAVAPLLSGVILLVPGSMGVRSTIALIDQTTFGNGSTFAFQVVLTALSLSLGILGGRIVPPVDSSLHSAAEHQNEWTTGVFKRFFSAKFHSHHSPSPTAHSHCQLHCESPAQSKTQAIQNPPHK